MGEINIFLSYCQKDCKVADQICDYFKNVKEISLHRDVIDIGKWDSIKEYMQSIRQADYAILLISDKYLKSSNCMFEVLEVMKDVNFQNKIFPAVIETSIYNPTGRAKYVRYWQDQTQELKKTIEGIETQNLGTLPSDLKRMQDIASNIVEFTSKVADMNNPDISEISIAIENKLLEKKFIKDQIPKGETHDDLFAELGIKANSFKGEPTEFDINNFTKNSFKTIVHLLSSLCRQAEADNNAIKISIDQIDSRTVLFRFYKYGTLMTSVKVFINNYFGSTEKICLAHNSIVSSNNAWNEMYSVEMIKGQFKLKPTMRNMGCKPMDIQEIVADIWMSYIQIFLER